jgi:hypothetical protein
MEVAVNHLSFPLAARGYFIQALDRWSFEYLEPPGGCGPESGGLTLKIAM